MHRALLVARHEFLVNLRRRSFLFASFGVPLLMIGLMVLIIGVVSEIESNVERVGVVGYVDQAGVLAADRQRPDNFRRFDDESAARSALDSGEIGAYIVLPADYMDTGSVILYGLNDTPEALEDQIEAFLRANIGVRIDDPELAARIAEPVSLAIRTLDNNRVIPAAAIAGLFLIPFIFALVLSLGTQVTSGYLMAGVVEEKSNRLMEILITSITPFELLAGKMLGLGALGLMQVVVWIGMGALALRLGQNNEFLGGIAFPTDLVAAGLVYFVLSYMLYAALMAGIGAVVGSEQESRQVAGLFSFIMSLPFFFIVPLLTDPNGLIAMILTLIPFTAPLTVILRLGFGAVPGWQLALSVAILALTTLVVVWASARVFRWALLLYGQRPGLRAVLRAIRRAPRPGAALSVESR